MSAFKGFSEHQIIKGEDEDFGDNSSTKSKFLLPHPAQVLTFDLTYIFRQNYHLKNIAIEETSVKKKVQAFASKT